MARDNINDFPMKMTWLFGGFSSAQPPSYNGAVIPARISAVMTLLGRGV